jgi:hypothetical protein
MTLPSSGVISLAAIRAELGLSGTISLGDTAVRTLLGKLSGAISLSDGYGKSAMSPVAAPTISPSIGAGIVLFTVTNPAGFAITLHYSINNGASWQTATISANSNTNLSFSVSPATAVTIRAYSSASGYLDSSEATSTATSYYQIAAPSVSAEGLVETVRFTITNTANTSVTTYYSTNNGATWTSISLTAYTAITVDSTVSSGASATLKAYSSAAGYQESDMTVSSGTAYVRLNAPTVTATPGPSKVTFNVSNNNSVVTLAHYRVNAGASWQTLGVPANSSINIPITAADSSPINIDVKLSATAYQESIVTSASGVSYARLSQPTVIATGIETHVLFTITNNIGVASTILYTTDNGASWQSGYLSSGSSHNVAVTVAPNTSVTMKAYATALGYRDSAEVVASGTSYVQLAAPSISATGQSGNLHFVISNPNNILCEVYFSYNSGGSWSGPYNVSAYNTLIVDKTASKGQSASMVAYVHQSGYQASIDSNVATATEFTAIPSLSVVSVTSSDWSLSATSASNYHNIEVTEIWNGDIKNFGPFVNGNSDYTNWSENTQYSVRVVACDSSGNLMSDWSQPSVFNTLEYDWYWYGILVSTGTTRTVAIGSKVDIDSFWFYATATTHTITFDATYTPTMSSTFDPFLELYSAGQVFVTSNDDGNGNRNSKIVANNLIIGDPYTVRCKSYGQYTFGNGTLTIV